MILSRKNANGGSVVSLFYKNMQKQIKEQPEIMKLIYYYRYLSLIITSTYFLSNAVDLSTEKKWFIVTCITISSVMLNNLYIKVTNSKSKTLILILIETVSNSIILIPSGGFSSPYVWYSLNSVLIASVTLPARYCWINLCVYLFVPISTSHLFSQTAGTAPAILNSGKNVVLSLILVTGMLQILAKYNNKITHNNEKLRQLNIELVSANDKIKGYINYIMEMYNTVQLMSSQNNKTDVFRLITEYASKIIKVREILLFEYTNNQHIPINTGTTFNKFYENILIMKLPKLIKDPFKFDKSVKVQLSNESCFLVPIKSSYKYFGALAIIPESSENEIYLSETNEQLSFISQLSSTVLEKLELEQINEKLVINEEQNRIAGEIHDSVLQRLFSASCALYTIIKKLNTSPLNVLEQEINIVRTTVNNTMKDLRSTIYGLSWSKQGANSFIDNVNKHIKEIKSLNNVDIDFNIKGKHELLTRSQKYALYRIICEGISNALHHGRATLVEICLEISKQDTLLNIKDNGIGFETRKITNSLTTI